MCMWITGSENTADAAEFWARADHARSTIEEAARTGKAPRANTGHYESHEAVILSSTGRLLSVAREPGATTLGQLVRRSIQTTGEPQTHVHTNMGVWPATTRLSTFGHFSGVQNEDRGPEGSLIITATTEGMRKMAPSTPTTQTEVWLSKDGTTTRTTVEMTAEERQEASLEDWVNQCYPDDWDTIMVRTADGSEVIEHPDREEKTSVANVGLQTTCGEPRSSGSPANPKGGKRADLKSTPQPRAAAAAQKTPPHQPIEAPALSIGAPNNQSAAGPPHPGGVSGTGGEKPSSHLNAANASSSPARAGGMSAPPRPPDLRELVHAEHQTCKHLTCDA